MSNLLLIWSPVYGIAYKSRLFGSQNSKSLRTSDLRHLINTTIQVTFSRLNGMETIDNVAVLSAIFFLIL